ncbi:mycofactocin precursor MftA [Parasphingorhabdus pacifica]
MSNSTDAEVQYDQNPTGPANEDDVDNTVTEMLVEEVSIDGMCGVY